MTTLNTLRVLQQVSDNLIGLQRDMRSNAQTWKTAALAGSVPLATLKTWMNDAAAQYLRRLAWRVDSDTWWGVSAERAEIADKINDLGLTERVIMLAGDMHGSAYDDGTNSQYGAAQIPGPVVLHAAPLDQANSSKGGPYSSGSPITDSQQQYGMLTLTFTPSVSADFKSYSWNGSAWVQRLSATFALS